MIFGFSSYDVPGLDDNHRCFEIKMGSPASTTTKITDFHGNKVDVGEPPINLNDFVNYGTTTLLSAGNSKQVEYKFENFNK